MSQIAKEGREVTLKGVKQMAAQLQIEDLRKLDAWLHDRLNTLAEEREEERKSLRDVIEVVKKGSWTYQLESVRCGSWTNWYGYRKEKGRTVSKYIGKKFKKV